MKNQLQVFENQEFGKIRVIEIDGQPWFVGKDVAAVLGYDQARKAILAHVDEDDGIKHTLIDSMGRKQLAYFINESGLYSLILSSKLPTAKAFKRWVTSDILPSIRRHGAYIKDDLLSAMAENAELTQDVIRRLITERDKNESLNAKNEALLDYVGELRPKALYHDTILKCANAVQTSLIAKDYGMTAIAFNKLLHSLKIQFKVGGTWVLYKNYQDMGYTVTNTYYVGGRVANIYTLWTQRGRFFLYDFLSWHGILPVAEKVNALMGGDDNLCQ